MAGICCYGSPHPTLVYNLKPGVQKKSVHSLRCRSTAPNNSNGMKPNPNPTPQLLTIAVNGLTELLRIFSSGNGRLDTENHVQRNEVSISSIDDIVMTLKLDYENAYFVTGIFTSAIYSDNCLFEDPTIKFWALGTMYAAVDACQVQPALKPGRNPPKVSITELAKEVPPHTLLFRCSPEVDNNRSTFCWTVLDNITENGVCLENDVPTKGCNSETSFVSATWKLRTFLRLPWRPLISVNGSTVYDLDDNFRIVRHAESWDISAVQAIGQIFTPSFLADRE